MSEEKLNFREYGSMCHDGILEAFQETVRDTDIFTSTEPKCGQTWLTTFLHHLKTRGEKEDLGGNGILGATPWLEIPCNFPEGDNTPFNIKDRIEHFESFESPRIFKMHVRYHKIPRGTPEMKTKSKIITITRDPRDLPWSFYNHMGIMKGVELPPWEIYANDWIEKMSLIPWMKGFWPHKDDEDLLWLRYEDLKLDIEGTARKILDFTGWDVTDEELKKCIELSSFGHMQKNERKHFIHEDRSIFRRGSSFIREGKVGLNRLHLTEEMEEKLLSKLRSELPENAVEWLLSDPKDHDY